METLVIAARIIIACVFAIAGIAKLSNISEFHKSLDALGVPQRWHKPISISLPWIELSTAILLVISSTAWLGGILALLCLVAFTTLIALNLLSGKRPQCNCFGQRSNEPIGLKTLVRNIGLLLGSLTIVLGADNADSNGASLEWVPLMSQYLGPLGIVVLVLVLIAVFLAWMVVSLLRQQGRIILRVDQLEARIDSAGVAPLQNLDPVPTGLPLGQPAPPFDLLSMSGQKITQESLLSSGKPVILIFSDPQCTPCISLIPQVSNWMSLYSKQLNIRLVSRGTVEDNKEKVGVLLQDAVLLQHDREVAHAYMAYVTPSAVRLEADGSIGSAVAQGELDIKRLIEESIVARNAVGDQSYSRPSATPAS